jgi:phosphatidylethanolamine/phosphatidyl-N-methylethanolamine N-methyltransferase
MRVTWNRVRYTAWAPLYESIARQAGFERARRRSIELLHLQRGDRVLIVGAGTGLDLPYVPAGLELTAIDITPAMMKRLEGRVAEMNRSITTRIMDARQLSFADRSFDAVIMHLILAVMPEPERGLREAVRVLKDGGRIAVFDKFLRKDERPSLKRRLLNLIAKPLFSDMNRRLESILGGTRLSIEHDQPVAFGGLYRIVTLRKPAGPTGA